MTAEKKEEVEDLLKLRKKLEKRLEKLKAEAESLQKLLNIIDGELARKSFKPAVLVKPREAAKPAEAPAAPITPQPPRQTIPLKASDGTLLATMHVTEDEVRVVPSEGLTFNVNTPPFQQFLVAKVLSGMAAKDREAASAGQLLPDQILTYRVVQDGDTIREIIIRNYREERRAATLRNAVRWTLEKMYEKTRI
ncbi:MAG: hypothetical protein AYL30_002200 [Candidatus Hecatellales archaeon B24]|nr:MAG: hypothetical protein AYL30_002200 [Candidatus Hecatellales archaeon B24]